MYSTPHDKRTDLQLIAEGDERAFYEFYLHHAALLRTFLRRNTSSEDNTEDIIQETFIRVWLYRDKLPEIENLSGWVYRIASRVYSDYLQKEIKRRERKAGFGNALYDTGQVSSAERTQLQELTYHLHEAIDKLSEHKKKLFWLNREQQMKPAAIAAHLGMPVGTVKNQLSATLREIREHMVAAGFSYLITAALFLPSFLFHPTLLLPGK